MSKEDWDQLRLAYKQAVDAWVIRAKGALATPDHSMTAFEKWDDAHFREQHAPSAAKQYLTWLDRSDRRASLQVHPAYT